MIRLDKGLSKVSQATRHSSIAAAIDAAYSAIIARVFMLVLAVGCECYEAGARPMMSKLHFCAMGGSFRGTGLLHIILVYTIYAYAIYARAHTSCEKSKHAKVQKSQMGVRAAAEARETAADLFLTLSAAVRIIAAAERRPSFRDYGCKSLSKLRISCDMCKPGVLNLLAA